MANRGAWTSTSSGSGNITIPAGYHNGSGYVSCAGAYNAGVAAGGNGKYKVKTGSVTLTGRSNGNGWSNVSISTGLSSVSGGMGRMVGTYGTESGNAFYYYSSSGGTVTFRGIDFNGDVTFYWFAYGS